MPDAQSRRQLAYRDERHASDGNLTKPQHFCLGIPGADRCLVLRFLLSGRAVERLVLGQVSSGGSNGVESDLAKAPLFALKIECEWELLDPPFWRPAEVHLANGMPVEIQPLVESRLAEAARGTDRMLEGAHDLWSCRVFMSRPSFV